MDNGILIKISLFSADIMFRLTAQKEVIKSLENKRIKRKLRFGRSN